MLQGNLEIFCKHFRRVIFCQCTAQLTFLTWNPFYKIELSNLFHFKWGRTRFTRQNISITENSEVNPLFRMQLCLAACIIFTIFLEIVFCQLVFWQVFCQLPSFSAVDLIRPESVKFLTPIPLTQITTDSS